ncbi:MAG TPA: glycosyl hydrolase family 65 protein [Polyangia bacterium]|nr:glycosyl hydrolase family 65 protein [Polyangia bacterium]
MAHLPEPLEHPFRLIVFDWDGTAVESRAEDPVRLRVALTELLRRDVLGVVVTGTNFRHLDTQLAARLPPEVKRNLYIATNRGSEVYRFGPSGQPIRAWVRLATAEEERLLTEIADAVRDRLTARPGSGPGPTLDVRVIYDRMNRRKIDLIPLPAWSDPPKSALAALLEAVQGRLAAAGWGQGLAGVMRLTAEEAAGRGLAHARITSDIKHVEVGLTDKADAVAWVLRELAAPRGIAPADILIGGDEFGPLAGVPGSDSRMLIPEARGAAVVSVGPEPGGAPPGVLHLGGGPARWGEILAHQVELHTARANGPALDLATPTGDPAWVLVAEGFQPAREHEIESLFAMTNGYLGVRGALCEDCPYSSPATFIAGVFDRGSGPGAVPALFSAPSWVQARLVIEGEEISLARSQSLEQRRVLDLRQGILFRHWRVRTPQGRITSLRSLQLASLAERHVQLLSLVFTPENYSGTVRIELPAGTVASNGGAATSLTLRTGSGITVALAATSALQGEGGAAGRRFFAEAASGSRPMSGAPSGAPQLAEYWMIDAELGRTYRLDRFVSIYTSRDIGEPAEAAVAHAERLVGLIAQGPSGASEVVAAHRAAWAERWQVADLQVEGDEEAQRALRLACHHLIGAAQPEDERVSIGARALTGDAYLGHVFWDTEIFMLPFFVLTDPAAARALLMYRYHTLPAARAKATRLGYRGALYAWESADSGEEVTPERVIAPDGREVRILCGLEEHHISADVAYAVWRYWQDSGDDDFWVRAGAEMVLETARFWASRVVPGPDGRYHILGVIGPDEYHESVDDNAYTNVLAQWNLERGVETAEVLARRWPEAWREVAARLDLGKAEVAAWREIAARLYTGFDPATGLFEQCRGFFGLEAGPGHLPTGNHRLLPIAALLERERLQRAQIVKQADVIMLLQLLWERFSPEVREANFRYYEPRTIHGSSLSPPMHALVAARLGDLALAARYFRQTIGIDLSNNMGNASGGVHAAALGGLWQATIFGFAGVEVEAEGLRLRPRLPVGWRSVRFALEWRRRRLSVHVEATPRRLALELERGEPLLVAFDDGAPSLVGPGRRYQIETDAQARIEERSAGEGAGGRLGAV